MAKSFWTQKQDIGPKPRRGHAMIFDVYRQRTVLFGGDSIVSGLFNDTWEWDGESWTQMTDMGPEPRSELAMAYDTNQRKVLLFGGLAANNKRLNDTWVWDGENWTQVEDSGPAKRFGHTMAFDFFRERVVLFGGSTEGNLVADTWEWEGDHWTQKGEAGPAPRKNHMLAYDKSRKQVILFGGWDGQKAFNDTWAWDGETWTQVADIGPEPCHHAVMVYAGPRVVLFGGLVLPSPQAAARIDSGTWEWFEKRWVKRTNLGPAARWGHSMAFDLGKYHLILFGGLPVEESGPNEVLATHLLGDTWERPVSTDPVENGQAGTIEALTLSPNTATFENIAAVNPYRINLDIKLGAQVFQSLNVIIETDLPNTHPGQVLIPAGLLDYQTFITIQGGIPVGTYTVHAKLPGIDKTATFTVT